MPALNPFNVAVIGAGPAGLMAADILAEAGVRVTVYERMPSVARKFLLAGRGGLNLTHSEALEQFIGRYGDARGHLRDAIEAFPPAALRAFSETLGQPTFAGSSGRVFPKAFKSSPLLRAWLRRLDAMGVVFKLRHRWSGWNSDGALMFASPEGNVVIEADATILALGGASWPRLGSDGSWIEPLEQAGIAISPLRPANCGFKVDWSEPFRNRFEGHALKRIALAFENRTVRGEAILTKDGIEGGAIYARSAPLRDTIYANGKATLYIDLLPDAGRDDLETRLGAARGKQSFSTFLRKALRLSPAAIGLLQEAAITSGRRLTEWTAIDLASLIKAVPVDLVGVAPLEKAISTAGGLRFDQIGEGFMLRERPGVFAAGEMLDWEAPTGGYLLQACFATGAAAGRGALTWLTKMRG